MVHERTYNTVMARYVFCMRAMFPVHVAVEGFQVVSAVFFALYHAHELKALSIKACLHLSLGTGECAAGLWFSKVLFYYLREGGL